MVSDINIIYLPTSPWSVKVLWAFDLLGVEINKYDVYTPVRDEYWLRWKTGKYTGTITAPVLLYKDDQQNSSIIFESAEMVEFADKIRAADKPSLLPEQFKNDIIEWNNMIDSMQNSQRALTFQKIISSDEEALLSKLPSFFKSSYTLWLGKRLATNTFKGLASKYPAGTPEQCQQDTHDALQKIRTRLQENKSGYLFGDSITYADLNTVIAFQGIKPVDEHILPMDPYLRRNMTYLEIADQYKDLIEWRDTIIQNHFKVNIERLVQH
ncbi:hypothetical protein AKO1_003045 [Acrasis kona]|uniref:Glutathione S-transferase n=1 Tax=Acrasis kona TaxID=1008807 RepID=A0AAW2ZMD4_9EUKA